MFVAPCNLFPAALAGCAVARAVFGLSLINVAFSPVFLLHRRFAVGAERGFSVGFCQFFRDFAAFGTDEFY